MADGQVDYVQFLSEVFPRKSHKQISEIVQLVKDENPYESFEQNMENMVNLLTGDTNMDSVENEEEEDEGAVGYGRQDRRTDDIYKMLVDIFPDASPTYLLKFCNERLQNFNLEEAIDILTDEGYDKREVDPLTLWGYLKEALPGADPSYLRRQVEKLAHRNHEEVEHFVTNAIEKGDYPTMEDYKKQKKHEEKLRIYKPEFFSHEKYLEVIPNPEEIFGCKEREPTLKLETAELDDIKYAKTFLYDHFRFLRRIHIDRVFNSSKGNLTESFELLEKLYKGLRTPRRVDQSQLESTNIKLLQEIAFLKNRRLLNKTLKDKNETYKTMKEEARKFNLLETCACCFDDELIPEECFFCTKDCVFCKSCVQKGVETLIGEGKIKFPCFSNCDAEFSLRTLQIVLPPKTFQCIVLRLQSEEIKQANIEGLETCPFCDFAKPLPACNKIFKCENPDCAMESCRECRHQSHIPKRCNEIEYDEDVRRRTYIENKMTEALTRTCHSCKKTFVKSNGCNKMTCSCGAKMCYLCGVAINDYSHFGPGSCPLFTIDNEVNLRRVLKNVEEARAELGNVDVKFDPSVGIADYYRG